LGAEGLGDGRVGVDVDLGQREPSVVGGDDRAEQVVERLALRRTGRPEAEHDDVLHRRLEGVRLEVLFADVDDVATGRPRRCAGRLGERGEVDGTGTREGHGAIL
jgi:hypothetical protein